MQSNLAYKEPYQEECWLETIGGKVVMMAPATSNHNRIARNFTRILDTYLQGRLCEYFPDGEGLYLEDGEQYRPDGMIVCNPDKVKWNGVHGAPDLVIEILSPSTARYDKGRKKDIYERHGVREYWIVNPADRSLEQYVLEDGHFVLRDVYHKYPAYQLADMKEEERAAIITEFSCALFDDLIIRLDDVFGRVVL